jgi:hypothetical protein
VIGNQNISTNNRFTRGGQTYYLRRGDIMTTPIAACGLDCAQCEAYIATQANDLLALEGVAKNRTSKVSIASLRNVKAHRMVQAAVIIDLARHLVFPDVRIRGTDPADVGARTFIAACDHHRPGRAGNGKAQ